MTDGFPMRAERPWSWGLRVIGVRAGAAQVELTDDDRLLAIFGSLRVETPLPTCRVSG